MKKRSTNKPDKKFSRKIIKHLIIKAAAGIFIILSAPALFAVNVAPAPAGRPKPAMHNTITQNHATNGGHTADWAQERKYWHDHYASTPYYNRNTPYSSYEPAYQYGSNIYGVNNGCRWDKLDQKTLREGWERDHGDSNLTWNQAQNAARDAYTHMCTNRAAYVSANNPMGAGR